MGIRLYCIFHSPLPGYTEYWDIACIATPLKEQRGCMGRKMHVHHSSFGGPQLSSAGISSL